MVGELKSVEVGWGKNENHCPAAYIMLALEERTLSFSQEFKTIMVHSDIAVGEEMRQDGDLDIGLCIFIDHSI